jgi:hypothetical protein
MVNKFLILVMLCAVTIMSLGQSTLYGVKNFGSNFQFIGIDCTNDSIFVLSAMPVNYYGSTFSSCFDKINEKYYYSTGQKIYRINVQTGAVEATFDFSTIHPYYLYNIVFNDADGYIYGIQQNISTLETKFTKFNSTTGAIANTFPLPTAMDVGIQCKSTINFDLQDYIIQSRSITAISIANGTIKYSFPIDTNYWDRFTHVMLDCRSQNLYGLYKDLNQTQSYFAKFDTVTGLINTISTSPMPVYFYTQNQSGSTIDNVTDIFYYAALGGRLYGIDLNTGNIAYSHDFGPAMEFLFLQSSSQFHCPLSDVTDASDEQKLILFPSPTIDHLILQLDSYIDNISIMDIRGNEITCDFVRVQDGIRVNVEHLSKGFYIIHAFVKSKSACFNAKFIKE